MRPRLWEPPVEPSPAEQAVIKAVRRAKLFVFLREHRHELFDEEFQAELAQMYAGSPKGQPPAQLALATILQAYARVSDDEVIEATVMDRRWQLVLDCMGAEEPPFSKGTLVGFRKRLIEHDLDRRLIERTVELAAATKGFGARALRAALDSSSLWGAGRVEDTFNLMGYGPHGNSRRRYERRHHPARPVSVFRRKLRGHRPRPGPSHPLLSSFRNQSKGRRPGQTRPANRA